MLCVYGHMYLHTHVLCMTVLMILSGLLFTVNLLTSPLIMYNNLSGQILCQSWPEVSDDWSLS